MIRAGVIGVGVMGPHHARIYRELPGVELVAIADPDPARREAVARRYKIAAYPGHEELLAAERLDVVSVAVPSAQHRAVTLAALARGVHVLVEKPIASSVADGLAMIEGAAAAGLTLAVGHIERSNPAMVELRRRLGAGELGRVFQMHARRMSPFPAYIRDVGVIMDLATHELDVMRHLAGAPVGRVYAETRRCLHERHEDLLSGTLRFTDGVVGTMEVNWITPTKIREFRITGERGMYVVDYLNQDLYFHENSSAPSKWDAMALFKGIEEGDTHKIRIAKAEPLRVELAAFVDAVTQRRPPVVTGIDGLHAVALAEILAEAGRAGRVLDFAEEARRRGWPASLAPALP